MKKSRSRNTAKWRSIDFDEQFDPDEIQQRWNLLNKEDQSRRMIIVWPGTKRIMTRKEICEIRWGIHATRPA